MKICMIIGYSTYAPLRVYSNTKTLLSTDL